MFITEVTNLKFEHLLIYVLKMGGLSSYEDYPAKISVKFLFWLDVLPSTRKKRWVQRVLRLKRCYWLGWWIVFEGFCTGK